MGKATKGARESGLTDQQERFCHEYVARGCSDAKGAAIAAGYSKRTAETQASDLLRIPKVQARIDALMQPILEKLDISAEAVLQEIARIGFSRIDRVVDVTPGRVVPKDFSQLSEDVLATVAEVGQTVTDSGGSIRIKLHDKLGALEKLGRHLKLWGDKLEITGPLTGAVAAMSDEELAARIVKGGGKVYRQGGRKVDHFGGLVSQAGGGRA